MSGLAALHGPVRPEWTCVTCGDPWPCHTRKRQLKDLCRCDVRLLRNYLTPYLRDARVDLVDVELAEITDRFLGWCGRPLDRPSVDDRPGGAGGGASPEGGAGGRPALPG
ncbi:flavin reductase [Micromonospora sp. CA-111912]|uniref:flavin reductase n=1 Tax=Micromonospora sp. CA-111912 TaxID=3239955 RepID=UPI003D922603